MTAPIRSLLLVCLLSLGAAVAVASEGTQTQSAPPVQLRKAPAPAVVKPEARRLPLTADQTVLEAIMERGQRDALALAAGLTELPAGVAREALQKKIVEVKIRTRVEFLHTLAAQQRAHGRLGEALATDAIAEQLLHPVQASVPGTAPGLNRVRVEK